MKWWNICVAGYGEFQYFGTREQADTRAREKSEWEGGRAQVRDATEEEAREGYNHIVWRRDSGYPLESWEREALVLS